MDIHKFVTVMFTSYLITILKKQAKHKRKHKQSKEQQEQKSERKYDDELMVLCLL